MADFSWKPEYADIFKNAEPEVAWGPEVADPKSTSPGGFSQMEIDLAKKMAIRVDGPKLGPHTWQDHLIMAREMLKKNPDFARQFMAAASYDPNVDGVSLEELAQQMGCSTDEAEEKYLKHCDAEDKIPGGRADKRSPEDFDKEQLEKGRKHEMEHTKDESLALEIAMDHLAENPRYYDDLAKIEARPNRKDEGEKPPVKDECDDCGSEVGACACKNVSRTTGDDTWLAQPADDSRNH